MGYATNPFSIPFIAGLPFLKRISSNGNRIFRHHHIPTGHPRGRSQDERWNTNLTAARQFHAREGHLRPARKHIEVVDGEPVRLGAFPDDSRRRAAELSPQRRAALDELGMRW